VSPELGLTLIAPAPVPPDTVSETSRVVFPTPLNVFVNVIVAEYEPAGSELAALVIVRVTTA
jgi:hypothetical protein